MDDIEELELAWAAGFFDGEGTFSAEPHKDKRYVYLRVSVGQNRKEPLERLLNLFGGKIYGPYQYGKAKNPIFIWRAKSQDAVFIATRLKTYLSSPKKEQLERILPLVNRYV